MSRFSIVPTSDIVFAVPGPALGASQTLRPGITWASSRPERLVTRTGPPSAETLRRPSVS